MGDLYQEITLGGFVRKFYAQFRPEQRASLETRFDNEKNFFDCDSAGACYGQLVCTTACGLCRIVLRQDLPGTAKVNGPAKSTLRIWPGHICGRHRLFARWPHAR